MTRRAAAGKLLRRMAQTGPTAAAEQEPEPGAVVRRLVRAAERAALASALARDGSGRPYASLVLAAADHDASPLLLLSDLADHSKNLARDPRAALLYDGTAGYVDPLTGPRASLQGEIRAVADEATATRLKRRFVARHPGAGRYADFRDFQLYRLDLDSVHLVAGFGRIHWLDPAAVLFDARDCRPLTATEDDIVGHMNGDHGEALALIARRLLGLPDGAADAPWRMTGIDPEGFDLRSGPRLARADFAEPIHDAREARAALVALARRARSQGESV